MSLNYDLTKCDALASLVSDEGASAWSYTEALIFRTMAVGMGSITEANAAEFYSRNLIFTKLTGGIEFTPAMIQAHIGLKTNVSYETPTAWGKRILEGQTMEARYQYNQKTIKPANIAPSVPAPAAHKHTGFEAGAL